METKEEKRSKWNTMRVKTDMQGKSLVPKAGEDSPTISRQYFFNVLRKSSRRIGGQQEKGK